MTIFIVELCAIGPWKVLHKLVKFVCAHETCGSNSNVLPNFSLWHWSLVLAVIVWLSKVSLIIADLHIGIRMGQ